MHPLASRFNLPHHIEVEAHYFRKNQSAATEPPKLVLVRGLPGSGKSTLARQLTRLGYAHFEADDYFVVDGVYSYEAARIRDAHTWCRHQARQALAEGRRVVVANTFTRLREIVPYAEMSDLVAVLWARGSWQNLHGVPEDTLKGMAARWEPLEATRVEGRGHGAWRPPQRTQSPLPTGMPRNLTVL